MGRPPRAELEARLGHSFADPTLLERALTHVSFAPHEARTASYQRLEFLGDRVLGLAVADLLFAAFPEAAEGELSQRLAELVRRETCAEVAAEWEAGAHLRLGAGEVLTGGARKAAILGDACEAIIGAVFLDGGFAAARQLVERSFAGRLAMPRRPLRDAKTSLQEWVQARGLPTPVYEMSLRSGPAHAPRFRMGVSVEGFAPAFGAGSSKRLAAQAAAEAFVAREGVGAPAAVAAQ